MCQWFSQKIDNDKEFLNDVWFSDKAHFLLNSPVNSKNWVLEESESLHRIVERPLHLKKCSAWVAISNYGSSE